MRSGKASKRRVLLAAAVAALGTQVPAFANTELDVTNGATDLTSSASYTQNTAPTNTSDVTFIGKTVYSPTSFSIGTPVSFGTLDDLDATQSLTITNNNSADATLTLAGGTNAVLGASPSDLLYVAAGGTLNIQNGPTNLLNLALGATGNFDIVGAAAISSSISGAFGFNKNGTGTLTLSGTNSYTGTTTINGGTLLATQASGSPLGTGSVVLNSGVLSLTPANVGSPASLTAATAASTTFTYGPGGTLALNANGNGGLTFTVGGGTGAVFARGTGGTLVISPAGGVANLGSITAPGENFVVNGTAPAVTNGIVSPSIVAQASQSDSTGTFLTYGAAGATGFSQFAGYTAASGTGISPAGGEIFDVTANATITPSGNNPYAVRGGSGNTLTIGGAASTLTLAGAGVILNGGTIAGNTLGFGANEGLIYTSAAGGLISSVVNGSNGITLFGPGRITLGATATTTIANAFTGGININGGTLAAVITQLNNTTAASPIGASGGHAITLNGGTFELLAGSALFNPQATTSSFVIGPGGGTVQLDAGGLTLDDAGQLVDSSGGTFTKTGTAQLTLGNGTTAFTVTGAININAGSLKLLNNGGNALGNATLVTIASGAEIDSDGLTVARPLALNGAGLAASPHGALTSTSGNLATISNTVNLASNASIGGTGAGGIKITGVVSGSSTLTKIDSNTLTLAAANTYTGGTIVTAGTLSLANTTGSAVGAGNVTLNPSGGSNLASGTTGIMTGTVIAATSGTNTIIGPGGIYNGGTLATFGTLTVGGLQLTSNATTLAFDLSKPTGSNDELVVSGLDALTVTGANPVPVALGQTPVATGTYHLVAFNQDAGGSIALNNFSLGASGNGRLAYQLALDPGSGTQQFLDLLVTGSATPITANFIGTSTITSWANAANWSTNPAVPGLPGDVVTFNNGSNAPGVIQVNLDGQAHVGSLTFNNTGNTSFNIAPGTNATVSPALFLDNNGSAATLTNSSNNNTISAPVTLSAATSVTVTGTTGGSPNVLTINGPINGASVLTLTNASTGVLVLSGANSGLTAGISVAGGTLRAGSATALGTATATVASGGGGTIDLNGQTLTIGLNLNGAGVGGAGALINNSTTGVTESGSVALQSATTIGGPGAITFSGIVSGSGAFTKTGPGNLTFSNNANTDTGAIVINAGTLTLIGNNTAAGTIQAPSIVVNSGASLVLANGDTLGTTANRNVLTINSGGSVLNTGTAKRDTLVNTVTMTGGTLGGASTGDANGGAYSLNNAIGVVATSDAAGNPAIINPTGGISLQGATSFVVSRGPAAPLSDLIVSTPIVPYSGGTNGFTKSGNGIMTLAGANTYTGPTAVTGGTLALNNTTGTVLGTTAVTVGSATNNATLLVRGNNTVGAAAGGSITIAGGDGSTTGQGTLSLADGTINTLTFANLTTAGTSLTVGSATNPSVLNFELGSVAGSSDKIALGANNTFVVNAGGGIVNIIPTGAIVQGTYTLINYGALGGSGSLVFSNSSSSEVLDGATLTLSSSPTAETLTVGPLTAIGAVPTTAWFQGGFDNNWSTVDASGSTNFTTDSAGVTNAQQVPGSVTDLHFYAGNANAANLATTLGGQAYTIKSLTLDGGTLTQNVSIASGGSGGTLTITPSAATSGITINSGAGTLTISAPVTLGATQTWTNNSTSLFTVSGPLSAGASALTVAGSGNTTITSTITGSATLTKSGAGTLTLAGPNLSTGATTIVGGTVTSGADNALSAAALTIGDASLTASTSNGNVNLGAFNQTLASLTAATNSTTVVNTITVGGGKTLTINGAGGLAVGYVLPGATTSTNGGTTKLTITGGGSLAVTNPAAIVAVGVAQTVQLNTATTNALDVSGLGSVAFGTAAAPISGLRVGFGQTNNGTLTLSNTANSIVASSIDVGNSNGSNPGNGTMTLGAGTNVLDADTINIGLSKSTATVSFASITAGSPGTVSIANRAGTGGATITIGSQSGTGTGAALTGTLDLRGHVSNVIASTVTIGNNNNNGGLGSASGVVSFDTGAFTASSLALGLKSSSGTGSNTATVNLGGGTFAVAGTTAFAAHTGTAGGNVTGTLNLSGGTFSTGSIVGAIKNGAGAGSAIAAINVSGTGALVVGGDGTGTFSLATLASGSAGSATGTLAITGGSVTSGADIVNGGGGATATVTLNGGLLDLTGHNLGNAAAPINTLNFQAGTLQNVAEINGGAALNKATAGTLVLTGNNSYTGGTNVNAGLLLANTPTAGRSATGSGAVVVNNGATLAGGAGTTAGNIAASTNVTAVTVNSGGTISAGSGTTTTGVLNTTGGNPAGATATFTHAWNAGGTYAWKLNSNNAGATQAIANGTSDAGGAGANWDMITMQSLNVPASGTFAINVIPVSGSGSNAFNGGGAYQWTIADITGTAAGPGIYQGGASVPASNYASLLAGTFVLNTSAFTTANPSASPSGFSLALASDGTANGEDLVVNYSAAPEPTSLALLGLAAGGIALRRRRRRRDGAGPVGNAK